MNSKTALLGGVLVVVMAAGAGSPAYAQLNLTGNWGPIMHEDQLERAGGPAIGDYAGLPINDAMRLRADSWDAGLLAVPEHQCKPHPSTYGFRGVGNMRIQPIVDERTEAIIAYTTHIRWMEQERTIWMDGREHPPSFAPHTWQGFSTGEWDGNVLRVRTTHLKAGWIRRNGMSISDEAVMTDLFIVHGDVMTHVYMVEDPHYLTEPMVKTNGFLRLEGDNMDPYPCSVVVEVPRERGAVPHHLPGENPFVDDFAIEFNLPLEAARGGAETALPEYMLQFQDRQ